MSELKVRRTTLKNIYIFNDNVTLTGFVLSNMLSTNYYFSLSKRISDIPERPSG